MSGIVFNIPAPNVATWQAGQGTTFQSCIEGLQRIFEIACQKMSEVSTTIGSNPYASAIKTRVEMINHPLVLNGVAPFLAVTPFGARVLSIITPGCISNPLKAIADSKFIRGVAVAANFYLLILGTPGLQLLAVGSLTYLSIDALIKCCTTKELSAREMHNVRTKRMTI